jgi:ABC-type transport system involved in Fe-S cluster assembly fused permease/ATPase subunit
VCRLSLSGQGKGRNMVVVAYRLATAHNADVIFVIQGGRVVDGGKHSELLRQREAVILIW